jgi:hypothetical protein
VLKTPIAETPAAQLVLALATYCTVVLTLLPFAGAETVTPAKAKVDALKVNRRRNLVISPILQVVGRGVAETYMFFSTEYTGFYVGRRFDSRLFGLQS